MDINLKFNVIAREPLHLLHDLNERKSSISFHGNFFSFFKLIILFAPEQFVVLPELHFLPPLKPLRFSYDSERKKFQSCQKKKGGAGANWGKCMTETLFPSAK